MLLAHTMSLPFAVDQQRPVSPPKRKVDEAGMNNNDEGN